VKKLREKFERAWKAFSEDEKPPPSKPKELVPTPFWIKVMTWVGAVVLVVMGFLVLREGLSLWKDGAPPPVAERASEITLTKPAEEAPAANQADAPKEKAAPNEQITGKWPTSPSVRSETLSLALLGTGAALLLAGAFAARVTSIKLPGGAEMSMGAVYGSAIAALSSQAQKEGKPELAEDSEKLLRGAEMLIARVGVPDSRARGVRAFGTEAAFPAAQTKRVLEELEDQ
jgi:hypothetical protein